MKTKFPAYYRIHKDDLLARFDDCVFMFDACALLDIYRMKKDVSEDVFKVMKHLKNQIRIPYHVAEEYFDNIHEVLNTQIANIKKSRTDFNNFIQSLESKRSQPYISKKANDLLQKLQQQVKKDFEEQENYIKEQLVHGEYQNRMNDLLNGNVLDPFSQEELKEIEKEGEKRREEKIPPGYKDANKSKNRCGDFINWKEILRYAKNERKCIIIVSSEIKEDWVIREQGCIVCLRYELLKEFYEVVGNNNQLIHFLSLDRFLDLAREKDVQVVSAETVNEVKDYVTQPEYTHLNDLLKMTALGIPDYARFEPVGIEKQIESWQKIQERLNPKVIHTYRDAMEVMERLSKAGMPFSVLDKKATKAMANKEKCENKLSIKGKEEPAKEKLV